MEHILQLVVKYLPIRWNHRQQFWSIVDVDVYLTIPSTYETIGRKSPGDFRIYGEFRLGHGLPFESFYK